MDHVSDYLFQSRAEEAKNNHPAWRTQLPAERKEFVTITMVNF